MGLFDFFFGKSEVIWTLDVYIEAICGAFRGDKPDRAEAGRRIRKWGEEILETYGLVGIDHAWRAVTLCSDNEELAVIVRNAWKDFPGWKI
jgi:hypothetical protein